MATKVNEILTSNFRINLKFNCFEETVDLKKKCLKSFWLIDPIDIIAGKDEYTLNAALIINSVPVLGLVGSKRADSFLTHLRKIFNRE